MKPIEDSTIVVQLEQEDIQRQLEEMPEDEKFIRLPGEIDVEGTGWTLIVASFSEVDRAEKVVEDYKAKGFKSVVLQKRQT